MMPTSAWLLLAALPIVCTWLPGRGREPLVLAASAALAIAALWQDVLAPIALPALLALYGCAAWAGRSSLPWRPLGGALFVLLALAVALRALPGFASIVLVEPHRLKPDSLPYALTLNPGKALVAVALLLWLVPLARTRRDLLAMRRGLPVGAGTVAVVLAAGWLSGYLRLQPGLPSTDFTRSWAMVNLLVVCTLEEGFFRGLVQRRLGERLPAWAAIGVAALLFGLAHLAGGWQLAALATLAGFGYGLVFQRSGQRIEAAIACHFAVNAVHLALFTYPAAG